jgi:hypothetical protein
MTRALYVAFLFASHLLSLGLAVYTTRTSGVPVAILLYAFLIDYGLRLGTIHFLHAAVASRRQTWRYAIAPFISKLPARGQQSHPVRDGEGGPPAGISKYLIVLAGMACFAFVLMNVDADKQVRLTFAATARDFWWALVIGLIYWANALLTRTLVIQPAEAVTRNFGYNSKEVTILALAVLAGGVVVAVRQNMGLDATGWAVMGPLLFFRFLFDLWASVNAIPVQPLPNGESSMRASRSHGPS